MSKNPDVSSKRVLLGLLGAGIQASRSPIMYEREADAQGIHCLYQTIDLGVLKLGTDAIPEVLVAAELMGFTGINVTHPCKQAVISSLTEISEDAREIGAVNTVLFRDGRRLGFNTDWIGFLNSFRIGLPNAALNRVVQLGAGGAGAATAYALLKLGAKRISLIEPDASKANALIERLSPIFGDGQIASERNLKQALKDADGIVHATPVGMHGHPGTAVPAELLRSQFWIAEVVYFPRETELLKHARATDCRTLDGTGMVIHQATAAFQLFFGRPADAKRMSMHFEEYDEDGRRARLQL
jgi:shikimate dehydrogenase